MVLLYFILYHWKSGNDLNFIAFVRIFFMLLWSFIFQILVCELGERVNINFELFNNVLNQCDWHLFSIEMQRMYVIIMMNAQQPIIVQGFGNFPCNRETFKRVSK